MSRGDLSHDEQAEAEVSASLGRVRVGPVSLCGAHERIESRSLTGKLVVDVAGTDWR